MIKPLYSPQLSSAKPRSGLTSIADVIPRLIRQYEIQAEFNRQQKATKKVGQNQVKSPANANRSPKKHTATHKIASDVSTTFGGQKHQSQFQGPQICASDRAKQTTFAWFE